ncbi:hypothetical protein F2Q69_00023049 [Brassica cretica]|uniref:Uncharacterized protein n=1 Tax=Brassica cretica TaxID=69181 RepID=A0A8S9PZL6_BRACR|nr:hypothetical protein F2Q69_00023049 [Brassica cretica]
MISWGPNSNTTDEIKSQTKGKICVEVTVAIHTLEKPDEATTPPSVTQMQTLNSNLSGEQRHYQPALTKKWNFPAHDKSKKRIDFIYGGSKFCNLVNSIKAYQRRAENNVGIELPNGEIRNRHHIELGPEPDLLRSKSQQLVRSQKIVVHDLLQEIYICYDFPKTSFTINCGLLLLPLLLQGYQHIQVAVRQSLSGVISCTTKIVRELISRRFNLRF